MKGLDWEGLTRRFLTLAAKTRTSEEFNRVVQLMFGETEGSHTGISGGATFNGGNPGTGYLGVRVKPVAGGFEVVKVTPESPASLKQSRINVGDVIVAVDSKRLSVDDGSVPTLDLDAALMGRAGRETLVELKRGPAPAVKDDPTVAKTGKEESPAAADKKAMQSPFIVITPVSGTAWTRLRYDEEVGERRALTEKLSNGRIGYLHIRAMGEAEVRDFERDLFAAGSGKDALLIDVRDNGGGSTADILLSSLTAPAHAYTIPRGADPAKVPHDAYPRDRRLIYGWTRPLDVLINEHSFSNAEIFAHAIKTTKRGRLVGTPTFGGVISTGAFTLIDGTNVRQPFRGWYLPDGTDMENHGAQPDVSVAQVPADEVGGKDAQLEAAVADLMKQIGK
jgi:tricorn protease